MWLFYYFNFERNYDVNINFNQKETKSKIENLAQFQRDEPCALAHIRIAN